LKEQPEVNKVSCHCMENHFLPKSAFWGMLTAERVPRHCQHPPRALPGQQRSQPALVCLVASQDRPRAQGCPPAPFTSWRKEWGGQRNANQAGGLIHPPRSQLWRVPGSLTTMQHFVRCNPSIHTLASHPLPGLTLLRHLELSL